MVRQVSAATSSLPLTRLSFLPSMPYPRTPMTVAPRVVIFPYYQVESLLPPTALSVSMMPRARFNLFSSPPLSLWLPPLDSISGPPLPRQARRMRILRACVPLLVSAPVCARSCNNNKKRATLWGTNGLRPVHPMLGGAGLILYPRRFSTRCYNSGEGFTIRINVSKHVASFLHYWMQN